jgi:hypothetical protein
MQCEQLAPAPRRLGRILRGPHPTLPRKRGRVGWGHLRMTGIRTAGCFWPAMPPTSCRADRTRPAALSAANGSPFGATRIRRGAERPEANRLTSNPFGTIGFCSLVRRTILTKFLADAARSGAGRFRGLISRRVPGRSARQSPRAAVLWSRVGLVWAKSGMTARKTIPATQVAMTARIGGRITCSRRGPIVEQIEIKAVPSQVLCSGFSTRQPWSAVMRLDR